MHILGNMVSNWKFKTKLEQAGVRIVKLLSKESFQVFFVGGIVRDHFLKRNSDNLDIATDATPTQVQKILAAHHIATKEVGKKFGTILAIVGKFPIEITTFRAEGWYSDKRHPDQVKFISDYKQDAKRRDFTINALYFDPIKKQLLDPMSGIRDQRLKTIRFVGNPKKRIDEDHLRMLRAVRLATQLKFKLEKNTFAAVKTRAKLIQSVPGERIKAELDKILLSGRPADGILLLDKVGLLKFLIPEIEAIKSFSHKSKLYHLEGTIFEHTLLALNKAKGEGLDLLYALLFHDIGKPQKAQKVLKAEGWVISSRGHADSGADIFLKFAKKMRFSRAKEKNIEWLVKNHMLMTDFAYMGILKQFELATNQLFPLLLKHWHFDEAATKRIDYFDDHHKKYLESLRAGKSLLQRLKISEPLMKKLARGELIMKYGNLKPGIKLGQKIDQVKAQIVLGKIKNLSDFKSYLTS